MQSEIIYFKHQLNKISKFSQHNNQIDDHYDEQIEKLEKKDIKYDTSAKIMFIPKNMKKMFHEIKEYKRSRSLASTPRGSKKHSITYQTIEIQVHNLRNQLNHKESLRIPSSEGPKVTIPMQASRLEKKSIDYLRNPSSQTTQESERVPYTEEERATTDKELKQLMEQLKRVGQDQNEHY